MPLSGSFNREGERIPRSLLQGSSNVSCSSILANPVASGTGASLGFIKKTFQNKRKGIRATIC
jgi:hypothetical protein